MKFFVCKHCGNIITFIEDKGVPVVCCGENMVEIIAGTVDAAKEKHIPLVTVEGTKVTVNVGEIEHPMLEEHHIAWVVLETKAGFQLKNLAKTGKPVATFMLAEGAEVVAVYEYCNLHGLWKS